MLRRWILYLNLIQTKKVSETNKASENGIEAKTCVNSGEFGYKQTGRGRHPLPPFSACVLQKQITEPTFGVNTLSSV